MRVGQGFGHRVHGGGRHPCPHQPFTQRAARVLRQRGFDDAAQCGSVFQPPGVGAEAAVFGQPGQPDEMAEAVELAVVEDADEHRPVLRTELVVGRDVGVCTAQQAGTVARAHPVRGVWQKQAQCRVVQRGLHMLADTVAVAGAQGHQDGAEGDVAGEVVHHRGADAGGAAAGVAIHTHHAADGLQHRVVAGQAAQRAVGAEAGDAAEHQARVTRRQCLLVAQTPALHGAGQEVLHQHVGVGQQAVQYLLRAGVGQVQADGFLAPVQRREIGGITRGIERGPEPAGFVAGRGLDLDDLGPVVCQDLRAQGAGEHPRQVHHLQPLQCTGALVWHGSASPAGQHHDAAAHHRQFVVLVAGFLFDLH